MNKNPVEVLRECAQVIADANGLQVDHAAFDAAAIVIDSHVRIPRPKAEVKRETMTQKAFRAYADAYARVYVRRPVLESVSKRGMIKVDTQSVAVSAKRLKELTGMLKERAKDL